MGVKHLWTILQGAGTSFDYESLQGQVISVDINIWLHQIQSHRVGQNPHAYLIDLLKRICKLLHYGIKPIFVYVFNCLSNFPSFLEFSDLFV